MVAPAVRRVSRPHPIEIPTVLLALGIHGAWLALTFWWSALPLVALLPLGAIVIAWHGSLQHEAVHGHPSGRPWIDHLVAGVPLWLWLPFPIYRESHLAHHATGALTDPIDDPESYYVEASAWRAMTWPQRAVLRAMQTLVGRLALGPAVVLVRFASAELRAPVTRRRAGLWLAHAAAGALVLAWVVGVCGMPLWLYLVGFVYPGLSLTLLRSFVEHRRAPEQAQRTAIVETNAFFGALFLYNNLHALHHAAPGVPWYRLQAMYRARKAELLAANGGYFFAGYREVARRFALSMKDQPVAPPADRGQEPAGMTDPTWSAHADPGAASARRALPGRAVATGDA